ncbi:MAG TPA: hypothetical protein VE173_14275 [Longimicrobiales bacterium]|nr:hypothetical protein [Longimicrobiales bacterium]
MGRYDDITPEDLREQLLRFARLIRAMEKQDVLLEKTPSLLRLLGRLRQMIFAYEVRVTRNLAPGGPEEAGRPAADEKDPMVDESARIVHEALEREQELQDELRDRLFPSDGDA